jgi:hypothetical protein
MPRPYIILFFKIRIWNQAGQKFYLWLRDALTLISLTRFSCGESRGLEKHYGKLRLLYEDYSEVNRWRFLSAFLLSSIVAAQNRRRLQTYYRWPKLLEKPNHFIPPQSASNLKGVSKKSGKGKCADSNIGPHGACRCARSIQSTPAEWRVKI